MGKLVTGQIPYPLSLSLVAGDLRGVRGGVAVALPADPGAARPLGDPHDMVVICLRWDVIVLYR